MGDQSGRSSGGDMGFPQPLGPSLLQWEGKHCPDSVTALPLRLAEIHGAGGLGQGASFDPAAVNTLYHGDNLGILAHLLASGRRGQVRLIYIDPPFDSNADYVRKIRLRDGHSRQIGKRVEYRDVWQGDSYLQFMYERLLLLRELLADDGSIWLHCDYRQVHRLHLLLEEVFGRENYLNTISWRSQVTRGAKVNAFYFPFSTQYIEIFARNRAAPTLWHPQRKQLLFTRRQAAAQFMEDEQGFFRTSDPGTYSYEKLVELHAAGRLYAPYDGEIVIDQEAQRVFCSNGGNIGVKYYLEKVGRNRYAAERGVDNLWDDIPGLGTTPGEDVGYPTQKTEALLRRIIGAATDPGDWVLDAFAGSGTTPLVAQQMGRRWLACDANYGAVQTIRRRLQAHGATRFDLYGPPAATPAALTREECKPRAVLEIQPVEGNGATIEVHVRAVRAPAVDALLAEQGRGPVTDWRGAIESIEIDPAYDGERFRPVLADAPQGKRSRINGRYTLNASSGFPVAVRITDVLGNEELRVIT